MELLEHCRHSHLRNANKYRKPVRIYVRQDKINEDLLIQEQTFNIICLSTSNVMCNFGWTSQKFWMSVQYFDTNALRL